MAWLDTAMALVKECEGCVLHAYPDPESPLGEALQRAGLWQSSLRGSIPTKLMQQFSGRPWTIGYGATGDDIVPGAVWSQLQADADLRMRLIRIGAQIDAAVKVTLTDNQKAALADFAYNEGLNRFLGSTLLRLLNQGNYSGAASQFQVWNLAAGHVVPDLVERRAKEVALFLR